jgi:phospholipid/cholesterol/gamma-HCH transport system substrate-binding protein
MLTTTIKFKLVAFVIIGSLATLYLGIKYVGFNIFGSGYYVKVSLPDASGSFANGEVTYRGVPVGRIKSLETTPEGMVATLHIEGGAPDIPRDVEVSVNNRSAIGEQYIDLRGDLNGGPLLADGDKLVGDKSALPPAIEEVLKTGRNFAASVPRDALDTVINEGYEWFRDSHQDLAKLLDSSEEYAKLAEENFLVTAGLIQNSNTVLTTQQASAASIQSFSKDMHLFAEALADNDSNLRSLITNSPAAARALDRLFDDVGTPLGVLMSNLVSTAQVFGTNAAGVEDAMIRLPEAMSVGWAIESSKGLNMGLALQFFDPKPCTTGYEGTQVRPGLDESKGKPFNEDAGCALSPSNGSNVRGPNAVPKSTSAKSTAKATSALGSGGSPVTANINVPNSLGDLMGGAE